MTNKVIRVKSCYDCSFCFDKRTFEYACDHPILAIMKAVSVHVAHKTIPDWCPLIKETITICLDKDTREQINKKNYEITIEDICTLDESKCALRRAPIESEKLEKDLNELENKLIIIRARSNRIADKIENK